MSRCRNKPSLGKTSVQTQACARMEAFCLMGHAFGGSSMKRTRTKIPKETPERTKKVHSSSFRSPDQYTHQCSKQMPRKTTFTHCYASMRRGSGAELRSKFRLFHAAFWAIEKQNHPDWRAVCIVSGEKQLRRRTTSQRNRRPSAPMTVNAPKKEEISGLTRVLARFLLKSPSERLHRHKRCLPLPFDSVLNIRRPFS